MFLISHTLRAFSTKMLWKSRRHNNMAVSGITWLTLALLQMFKHKKTPDFFTVWRSVLGVPIYIFRPLDLLISGCASSCFSLAFLWFFSVLRLLKLIFYINLYKVIGYNFCGFIIVRSRKTMICFKIYCIQA